MLYETKLEHLLRTLNLVDDIPAPQGIAPVNLDAFKTWVHARFFIEIDAHHRVTKVYVLGQYMGRFDWHIFKDCTLWTKNDRFIDLVWPDGLSLIGSGVWTHLGFETLRAGLYPPDTFATDIANDMNNLNRIIRTTMVIVERGTIPFWTAPGSV